MVSGFINQEFLGEVGYLTKICLLIPTPSNTFKATHGKRERWRGLVPCLSDCHPSNLSINLSLCLESFSTNNSTICCGNDALKESSDAFLMYLNSIWPKLDKKTNYSCLQVPPSTKMNHDDIFEGCRVLCLRHPSFVLLLNYKCFST